MTVTYFRSLILISFATGIAGGLVDDLFPSLISVSLNEALNNQPLPAPFSYYPLLGLALIPVVIAVLTGTIGMVFFHRWARSLSVGAMGVLLIVAPFTGAQLLSGLSYALIFLSTTTWGAVLAIAYFTPLSERFVRHEGSNAI